MPRVAVNIVTWNSMKYLADALESIYAQRFTDFAVLIIDNASDDGTVEFVRQNYPKATVLRNTRNHGFCRAHNQGLTWAQAHLKPEGGDALVLVTNPDIIMEPDFLGNLVSEMDRRPSAGSGTGRILKAAERYEDGMQQVDKTETIDTCGLLPFRSGRVADRGSGKEFGDSDYNNPEEVFGASGCVAVYRLAALTDAAYDDGSIFDEDFFAYKEDVDLAWRLRLLGWKAVYAPDAIAYHFRTAAGGERPSALQVIRGRRSRSPLVNYLSVRNHLLMLAKNYQLGNWVRYWPLVAGYELQKGIYTLFFEPRTLGAGWSFIRLWPKALGKRRQIMKRAKARSADIRKWLA